LRLARLDVGASEIERLAGLLSDEELERAGHYIQARDAARFVARRGRLRALLAAELGLAPNAVRLAANDHGKPIDPERRLSFSLSHSCGLAHYAVSRELDVGCDLEVRRAELARPDVAERFFSPRERAQLALVAPDRWTEAFFNCWTRKEALIKGLGLGLAYPLESFDVSLTPGEPAALLAGPPGWTVRAFEPLPGLHAAVAFKRRADDAARL
jgi:4'-phosphopantetheinyl transferase